MFCKKGKDCQKEILLIGCYFMTNIDGIFLTIVMFGIDCYPPVLSFTLPDVGRSLLFAPRSVAHTMGGCSNSNLSLVYWYVCLFVGCLTSQQRASVSQGRICSDNFTCCHTEIEVADQTFHLTQSQYTDTGLTSPRADPITPGAWQGSHWSANFKVTGMTRPRKKTSASRIRTRDLLLSRQTPYH